VSYAAKIKKEDGHIDWNQPANTIRNRLRAFTPWPGAFTFLKTELKPQLLKIWKAEVAEVISDGDSAARRPCPGEILSAGKTGIIVACGQGALRVLELQREGGRRMTAAEFLVGNPLKAGGSFSQPDSRNPV
jgi:methionyl-tRNA formyltransferase